MKPSFFTALPSLKLLFLPSLLFLISTHSFCQTPYVPPRLPAYAVGSLTLVPDARSAAMGDAGAASSPDANSTFWNASKLAFAEKNFGASLSYGPWLSKIVDNVWHGYATAYKKLGSKQAIAASVKYYANEELPLYTMSPSPQYNGSYRRYDYSVGITYARQFGENFSLGATVKIIGTNSAELLGSTGNLPPTAHSAAADIGAFYTKQLINDRNGKMLSWSLGATLSDFGDKINYGIGTDTSQFLPTALRVGGGLSFAPNNKHRFNIIFDANKFLVQTPDTNGIVKPTKSVWEAMVKSFSDAPGGFSEEMQEINLGAGIEYWYKGIVALRGGYHGENKYKGDRKYFTAGAGVRIARNYCVDVSYLFPTTKGSPLAQTFRVTGSVYLGKTSSRSRMM